MNPHDLVLAACLTPPAPGGIAVVQVTGRNSSAVVAPMLRTKRPLDLDGMEPGTLRLCRLVDGEQALDDVIVTVRRDAGKNLSITLSLHGGPRIVQRLLLMLKRGGARIVDPAELLKTYLHPQARHQIDQEFLEKLLEAKTRAVASWLARTVEQLEVDLDAILCDLDAGRLDSARDRLSRLCEQRIDTRYLLVGVRVVLIGEPNTGKSTLANQLAGRDAAIVCQKPGTTRDWTEHPGAIDGAPFTFVDTAGIREALDPIEQEAIRRTHQQIEPADLVLRVIDGSAPPTPAELQAFKETAKAGSNTRQLLVWNKSDLPLHASHMPFIEPMAKPGMLISAKCGEGLDCLQRRLITRVGLVDWQDSVGQPFTQRQLQACRQALSALTSEPPDRSQAAHWLQSATGGGLCREDPG